MDSIVTVLQAIGTVVAIVAPFTNFPKTYLDTVFASRDRARVEYEFAKKFMDDVHGEKPLHPFVREKGFQAVTGYKKFKVGNLEYLLSLRDPVWALRQYARGWIYLQNRDHDIPASGFAFKWPYQKKWVRIAVKIWYFVLYTISVGSLYLIPAIANASFSGARTRLIFAGVWFPLAICVGWYFLSLGTRISDAEALVERTAKSSNGQDGAMATSPA